MRMARVNVYLPDDLAAEARAAGLNVSRITQDALRAALAARRVDEWLDDVGSMRPVAVSPEAIAAAIEAAKQDLEHRG